MMTVALSELFDVEYGNKLDFNKMTLCSRQDGGVNFVGRAGQNHGVSAIVRRLNNTAPYEAGLITVALGGSKLLTSFVQPEMFYTAQNVAVLTPRIELGLSEKIYYCLCIRHNRFRYSAFGREANRSLKCILLPDVAYIPNWVRTIKMPDLTRKTQTAESKKIMLPSFTDWLEFKLDALFNIKKGKRLTKDNMTSGLTPFVGASDSNNGITAFIGQHPKHDGGTISVSYNGSVGEAFYQPIPFCASDDVNILYPKFDMDPAIALFLCTLIKKERYRFSYGRKWHLDRMRSSKLRLPVNSSGMPDWEMISHYMRNLRFSAVLGNKSKNEEVH